MTKRKAFQILRFALDDNLIEEIHFDTPSFLAISGWSEDENQYPDLGRWFCKAKVFEYSGIQLFFGAMYGG